MSKKRGSSLMAKYMIEKAQKDAKELARRYDASVVWMGGNHYIIVKDGVEYKV